MPSLQESRQTGPIHPPETLPVILDVDTGFDDALALLLALRSPRLDVLAVTCVAGNHRLPQVVANTLKTLDVAQAGEVPVAAGMARALLEPHRPPMALHGTDGMADLGLAPSTRDLASVHAVELLRQTLEAAAHPVTLIALAPLTNVACALRMYPHLAECLESIMVMGGTFAGPGNTSPVAEFNIRCDPEAAAIVFDSGVQISLYTLDVFRQVGFNRAEIEQFCQASDPAARMAGDILRFSCRHFDAPHALIGDAGAVAMVIEPGLAQVRRYPLHVELAGQWTRGQTVVDRRPRPDAARLVDWSPASDANVTVVEAVDVAACRALFAQALGVELG